MGLRGPVRLQPGQTHHDQLLGPSWAWDAEASNGVAGRSRGREAEPSIAVAS